MVTTVAEALEAMRRLGWTMTTLADGLGVSRASVNRWWRGTMAPTSPQLVLLALRALRRRKVPPAARRGPKPRLVGTRSRG